AARSRALRQHGKSARHRTGALRRDRANQEGAVGAGHQVHGDGDGHDATLRLAEPCGSRAVHEGPRPDHHRAGRLQAGSQDGAPQAPREGTPVRDERQARCDG
ncbi:MAG: hypothetical protein ACK559_36370, partial [bacterium]